MVEREVIRRIIIEGQEFVNEISLTERPFFFEQKGNYVFVGIRQAGKSYLLYQRIQQLLREEHNINEIVYINFDDERLRQMTADDLDLILQAYHSLFDLWMSPPFALPRTVPLFSAVTPATLSVPLTAARFRLLEIVPLFLAAIPAV